MEPEVVAFGAWFCDVITDVPRINPVVMVTSFHTGHWTLDTVELALSAFWRWLMLGGSTTREDFQARGRSPE